MADRIVLNTISYHGHGAIENIVPELTARGYKKAFVCSDPDLIKFGVTGKITALLDAASFPYAVYSEIKPNPTIQNVQDGVAAFKAAEADCIVTIGGGSSMDTAKAIGIIINNPEFADVQLFHQRFNHIGAVVWTPGSLGNHLQSGIFNFFHFQILLLFVFQPYAGAKLIWLCFILLAKSGSE